MVFVMPMSLSRFISTSMFRILTTITLLIAGSASADTVGSIPLRAAVGHAESPPAIDGELSDTCWQGDGWLGGFSMLNAPDQEAKPGTRFQWVSDNTWLYLAIEADEPRVADLPVPTDEPSSQPWELDSVELMLAPNDHGTTYYHFAFGIDGGLYDAKVLEAGRSKLKQWKSTAFFAVTRGEDRWSMEAAIPLADLELAEAGGIDHWLFNVTRNRYVGGSPEHTTFAPIVGSFHDPSRFADLDASALDVSVFAWEVHGPVQPRVTREDGGHQFSTRLLIHNRTDRFRFIKYEVALGSGNAITGTAGVASGQPCVVDVKIPIDGRGEDRDLRLTILNRANGDVWARWQATVDTSYSPLELAVYEPAYRQSFFASHPASRVAGVVRLAESLDPTQRLSLRLLTPDGVEAYAESFASAASEQTFEFDLPEATGDYRLVAVVQDAKTLEPVGASVETVIHRWPAASQEVIVDEHGVTRKNGKPFMPFGWFSIMNEQIETAGPQGFNVTMDYNNYYRTEAEQQAYLDRLHAAGLQVLSYPYPTREMNLAPAWQRPLTDDEAQAIREYVTRWKDHPAILAWYMADEPELRPALVERADAIYDVVRAADPYHPCVMLNDTLDGIRDYYRGGDVIMPDPYPHFLVGGGSAKPMEYVGRFVEEVDRLPVQRASWLTPQAFNYADFGRANNREPNFVELRNMMYQGVVGGSTGFVWYSHLEALPYPDLIASVAWLEDEARQLELFILAPYRHEAVAVDADHETVRASLRRVGEAWCLVAVNVGLETVDAAFTLPANTPTEWRVMSEGRALSMDEGQLHDRFAPNEAHVYFVGDEVVDKLSLPVR